MNIISVTYTYKFNQQKWSYLLGTIRHKLHNEYKFLKLYPIHPSQIKVTGGFSPYPQKSNTLLQDCTFTIKISSDSILNMFEMQNIAYAVLYSLRIARLSISVWFSFDDIKRESSIKLSITGHFDDSSKTVQLLRLNTFGNNFTLFEIHDDVSKFLDLKHKVQIISN